MLGQNHLERVGDDVFIVGHKYAFSTRSEGMGHCGGSKVVAVCDSSNIIIYMPDSLRQFKAEIFQALAHPTRIAILDLLRQGEVSVSDFVEQLKLEQANLSQHLAVLRARQIVVTRKAGNQVFYSLRDPLIWKMLDLMRRYFQKQVGESMAVLEAVEKEEVRR